MIKMKPRQGRLVMTGHNLPYAVPVRKFYGTYIEDVKSSTEHTLSTFLKSNFRCLRAFLSREDQVEELRQDVELKSYIKEIQAVNHFTCIQGSVSYNAKYYGRGGGDGCLGERNEDLGIKMKKGKEKEIT